MPVYPNQNTIDPENPTVIDNNDTKAIYSVHVIDSNGNNINGAIVMFNKGNITLDERRTNNLGLASYSISSSNVPDSLTVEISKSGYNITTGSVSKNETKEIVLQGISIDDGSTPSDPDTPSFGELYTIIVKDSSDDTFINDGVKIELRRTFSGNVVDTIETDGFKGRYVYIDEDGLSYFIKVIKNGYEPGSGIVSPNNRICTVSLNRIQLAEYFYVLKVQDENNNPIPGVSVGFYTNFSFTTPWCKCSNCGDIITSYVSICPNCQSSIEMYKTTDENGLVSIPLGELSNNPGNKYVRVENLPDGYTSDGSVTSGSITPTLSANEVGCTLTLKHETLYTYGFIITNKISGEPITVDNVVVNGESIGSKPSQFELRNIISDNIEIVFKKNGYDDYYDNFTPAYYSIRLSPDISIYCNSIRILKNGVPVKGKRIRLFFVDGNTEREISGTYETNDDGYIYLDKNYYSPTTGHYYIKCDNEIEILSSSDTEITINIQNDGSDDEQDTKNIVKGVFGAFNEMSVGSIKTRIDSGNKENDVMDVEYHGKKDYKIKILNPDSTNVYDIFEATPVKMYNDEKNIISSMDVGLKSDLNELRLKMINRYSGYYNPIFKDILFYNNMTTKDGVKCPFSNTSFDYNYKDNYGAFGIINNMWFHKVNSNEDIKIINTNTLCYPLSGQYALDYKDYNVFETNWDTGHYIKQTDIDNSEACENISSMKDGLCMFGSKYLNVPETIEIYGLTLGTGDGEWNDEWITQPKACPGEIMFKEVNDNSVDFYIFLKKRIVRFFQDKLREEFGRYINENVNSFDKKGIDDDIEEYVKKNIFRLYKLEKVRMFVRRTKRGIHNSMIENDYTKYLEYDRNHPLSENEYFSNHNLIEYFRQHGFIEVNNIRLNKINTDDFDRKLVYNLKSGIKEEFGFSFIIKKI